MGISPVPLGLYGDETITARAWSSGITGLGFVVRSLTFARPVIDLRATVTSCENSVVWRGEGSEITMLDTSRGAHGISPASDVLNITSDLRCAVQQATGRSSHQFHDYTANTKCTTAPTLTSKTTRHQHPHALRYERFRRGSP